MRRSSLASGCPSMIRIRRFMTCFPNLHSLVGALLWNCRSLQRPDVLQQPSHDDLRDAFRIGIADFRVHELLTPDGHFARTVRTDDETSIDDFFDALARKLAAVAPRNQREVRHFNG